MLLHVLNIFSVVVSGLFGQCFCAEADTTKELTLPVTTCKRDSPDYSTCLKHAIQEAWPRFIDGLPEFNFPPLDPLWMEYHRDVYNNGELHAEVIMTNLTVLGYKTTQFVNVRPHFLENAFRLEIDANVPQFHVDGHAKGEGKIAGFRMGGEGFFNMTIKGIKLTWDINGQIHNDRLTVEHFYLRVEVNKVKVYFNDLFESKELNDLALSFVNEYWPILYRVMLPVTVQTIDPVFTNLSNRIFSKVSFSKLFP